jgi:hypothetical protein
MKNTILNLTSLALVSFTGLNLALANSQELTDKNFGTGEATVYTGGSPNASVAIDGDAARVLYEALAVEPEGNFGLVQTQTKKTALVECEQAILGDVRGEMSGPKYHCSITVSKK